MMNSMERKIGEIFEHNGDWYQVVECSEDNYPCIGCCGCKGVGGARINGGECNGNARNDRKFVIFKKLEKVGEPYEHYEKLYQCYKLPMETEIRLLPDNCYPIGKDNLVEIEIKENKEDMEEKKLNLKPFDIQKAREGKPVCTRDGRKARIFCFDLKNDEYPIVAAVENDSSETLFSYTTNGEIADGIESDKDLMMFPEKRSGWVNVYSHRLGGPYESKEYALKQKMEDCIDTVKISWEE